MRLTRATPPPDEHSIRQIVPGRPTASLSDRSRYLCAILPEKPTTGGTPAMSR